MAGDWIPYNVDLPRKREVIALSRICKMRPREVVAILMEFWAWASIESADGSLQAIELEQLPFVITDTKASFWRAVASPEVGWLVVRDGGLYLPNWDRWLAGSAKERLLKNRRQAKWRAAGPSTTVGADVDAGVDVAPSQKPSTTVQESTVQERASGKEPEASTARGKLSDAEWLDAIRSNPAYAHVDLNAELSRMDLWLSANPQRKKTRGFIVNWLNRIEKPVTTTATIPAGNGRYASSTQRNSENIRRFLAEVDDDGETGESADGHAGDPVRRAGVGT